MVSDRACLQKLVVKYWHVVVLRAAKEFPLQSVESKRLESLKKKSDFLEIKKSGKRIRLNNWLLLNYRKNESAKLRVGMTIPKKVGIAVVRNKLKRWCRECLRHEKMPGVDINVVFLGSDKNFFKELEFRNFKEAFGQGISRIAKSL